MKNLIIILFSVTATGQVSFGNSSSFNAALLTDPYASYKEKGINIGAEIEMVENWGYIRTGIQTFHVLEGGYIDWTTGMGLNFKTGYFDDFRYYAGGRIGFIWRDKNQYPTVGCEIGAEYNFGSGLILGIRGTYDYRSDFEFWGGESEMRFSGFVKVGWKL